MSMDRLKHRIPLAIPGREPGPKESRWLEALEASAEPLAPEGIPGTLPEGGGWLLMTGECFRNIPPGTWLKLARSPDPWALLVLFDDPSGEDPQVVALSPGYPEELSQAGSRLGYPDLRSGYLNHRGLLQGLSRHRHDVNNALAAALAETQFMLMDAPPDSEMAQGLALVEEQLRRIRDLVAELTSLRLPRP